MPIKKQSHELSPNDGDLNYLVDPPLDHLGVNISNENEDLHILQMILNNNFHMLLAYDAEPKFSIICKKLIGSAN